MHNRLYDHLSLRALQALELELIDRREAVGRKYSTQSEEYFTLTDEISQIGAELNEREREAAAADNEAHGRLDHTDRTKNKRI